ncbi:MAG: BatD family protein, partial [Candidatus Omnitrophica bacterium]|nr:BatD family protein [Candidatus Omnitrophota bacterium]
MKPFSFLKSKLLPFVMMCFLMANALGFAQETVFTATVDTNKIALGNAIQLVLTIQGKHQVDQIPQPVVDGFEVQYFGPRVEVSSVNGNYSTSRSFVYTLFSLKTGKFTVPAITVNIEGKDYATAPIELTVEDAAAPSPAQGSQAPAPQEPSSTNLKDKIMLSLQPEQKEVYLHQQVPVHAKLFVGGVQIDNVQYPAFEAAGFTMTNFTDEQYQQVLNGVQYTVVDFKTFITPTRTGDLTLGPAQLQASLLSRMENQSATGNNVFDSFFTTYQRRPFTVNSATAAVKVLPLPEEGKPKDFSDAVGTFDFEASISPIDIKVGDPITLRMKVTGQGDMKAITMPVFS